MSAAQSIREPAIPDADWPAGRSHDQLASMLFIAALLHGVIIMGVTFTGEEPGPTEGATSLEVVLLNTAYREQDAPADAELLAERSLSGSGNTVTGALTPTTANPGLGGFNGTIEVNGGADDLP